MKLVSASTFAAALAIATIAASSLNTVVAADISVTGATDATPTMRGTSVNIATTDILNRATALVNKNAVVADNNIVLARSNVAAMQNDRIALAKQVEQLVTSAASGDASTAVLTKSVLKAVFGKDASADATTMTKASAVVAAKDDASTRGQRITDLVNTVFDTKQQQQQQKRELTRDEEQAIQSAAPNGVIVLVGTKDILRQPTAVVNKNVVVSDTQIAVSRSTVAPSQNDNVALAGNAKVATVVAPASSIRATPDVAADVAASATDNYRMGFLFAKSVAKTDAKAPQDALDTNKATSEGEGETALTEQLEFLAGGLGCGFGWRYPLGYWNTFGAGLYGNSCGLGLAYGPYFYC